MKKPKIEIKYKNTSKYIRSYQVQIDGINVPLNEELDGCRAKFVKDGIIVKADTEYDLKHHTQCEVELALYKKFRKNDKKYFPKLIAGSGKIGYIAQEYIKLRSPNKAPKKIKDIVRGLIARYNISDVGVGTQNWNWGVCARTGNPIIYDFGFSLDLDR